MTDKKKQPQSRCTGEFSPEELRAQIEEDKKKAGRSAVFMFAALIAIIVICIAWFVANTRVHLTTGTISAQNPALFELASVGSRTAAESGKLKDEADSNLLTDGNEETEYEEYRELNNGTWTRVESKQTYYTGTADLAWHLRSSNGAISPGAEGKLEFYIIPKVADLKSVEVTLSLEAYQEESGRAVKSKNDTLQNLIQGHILLFQNLQGDTVGYSGWLQDGKLKITPSDISTTTGSATSENTGDEKTFERNVPYKVTVYWVWPKRFQNYIYNQRDYLQEDLFGSESDSITQGDLLTYVRKQAAAKTGGTLFYIQGENAITAPEAIGKTMERALLDECSNYYNAADEYIGTNARYLYVKAAVTGTR